MGSGSTHSKDLFAELQRLAASENGFNDTLNADGLPPEDRDLAHLFNRVLKRLKTATEYDLMKYKLASNALKVGHWDMDVNDNDPLNSVNRFTWSQELRHMLGFTDERDFPNILSSWSDRLLPEEKYVVLDAFSAHLHDRTGKIPFNIEYGMVTKSGEIRYFHAFGETLRDEDGTPLRVAGALEDITERVRQEELLTNILNNLDAIILATVPETGEILFINDKNKAFFGVEDKDGTGIPCFEFLHGRSKRCDYCPFTEIEKTPDMVVQWEPSDPHIERVFRMTAMLIDWPGGKKAHLEFGVDITEAKRSQEILINILNSLDALILATIPNTGEILFINDKYKSFCGVDGDGIGQRCYTFLHGKTERCAHCPCGRLLKAPGEVVRWEAYIPEKDITHSMTSLLINWPGGKKAELDFGVDISERKRAKEALEKREKMLDIMNRAALVLLSRKDETFEDAMTEGARLISGIAQHIDRMSISRNIQMPDGLYASQIYRWTKDKGSATDVLENLQVNPYARDIPRWETILSSGECVNGLVRDMPEADALKHFGCLALVAIPIIVEDVFWGFVLFENLTNEQVFTEDEADMLRSASFMLANVVIRNEEAKIIREADEHAKLMLNATPLSCTLWSSDHKVIDCNDATVSLFGLSHRSELAEKFFDCCPEIQPDGRPTKEVLHYDINKALKEGRLVHECMHQTLSGTPIPAEVSMIRVKEKAGYVVAAYVRDLREQKRMMSEIERQNVLLHAVNRMSTILLQTNANDFESDLLCSMGIMAEAIDVDRVTIWKNFIKDGNLYASRIHEWWNITPDQSAPLLKESSYRDDLPEWLETLSTGFCVTGNVSTFTENEKRVLIPQGVESILVVPIFFKGQFWGYLGFDNCYRERLFSINEEAIIRSASELIADALIRNDMEEELRDVAEDLQIALTEAQSANRAKSDFLSRMSHEMRTPLNAVIGMTTIGKSMMDSEKKDYAFSKIDDASKHLLGVINDVLDMSKIEANKLELSSADFVFDRLLQKAVNVVNFRVEERKQSLYVNIDRDIPASLIGDDQRLSQVITNLLSNAVKFTPEGGTIRLEAKLLSEENGLCRVQISVSDTGIGLTEEQKSRIFRSFEQADIGTSRQYGGTGLGLSISKRIVELMDGEIWVQSEAGQGATFTFTAVFRRGEGSHKRLLAKDVNWDNIRIFAVDDDREVRDFFMTVSANLEISCEVAASGEEAIDLLDKDCGYDIYFIDWKLPGMNGIELANSIRCKLPPESLVLLFSSTDWSVIENDARAAGINKFLQKPLFQTDIVDVINESLGLDHKQTLRYSAPDNFAGSCILLAEDVEINREVVFALLEPLNLTIECAADGAQALRMFEEEPERYDLIFMDIQMPIIDGYEATRLIRALDIPRAKTVPIVAMTANVFREDIERCLEAGMDAHIGKPIIMDDVIAVLKRYL